MFDASNRQTCRVRQSTTSTPLHALTMLNDPTWVEAARVLAQESMKANKDVDARLADAFRKVICRAPTAEETKILRRAFEKQEAIYKADPMSAKAFLSIGSSKRDESLDLSSHAGLSAVCLAIMNLDEAMTRE
jgi:hypothetical protein